MDTSEVECYSGISLFMVIGDKRIEVKIEISGTTTPQVFPHLSGISTPLIYLKRLLSGY